jgi:putative endonuclease
MVRDGASAPPHHEAGERSADGETSDAPRPEERPLGRVSKDGRQRASELTNVPIAPSEACALMTFQMRASRDERRSLLYILRCADGSYYVGTTRSTLEVRIAQHNDGTFGGYTEARRPVELVFSQWFDRITDAIENERKIKKWSRAKKQAFIRGDMAALRELSRRRTIHPSRRPPTAGSSG